jgi:integrase
MLSRKSKQTVQARSPREEDATAEPTSPRSRRKRDRLDPRKVRIGGKVFWQVDLGIVPKDGRPFRQRRTFAERQEAETFAQLKKIERTNRGTIGINLSERSRAQVIECEQLLAPYPDVSMLDIIRDYVRRRESTDKSETAGKAFKAFLSAKTGDGLRPRYLSDLHFRVGRFAEVFRDRKLAGIEVGEIDNYLRDLGLAPLTRNTHHMRLSSFFEYCRQRGWVQANPLLDVPRAKVAAGPPGILTPEQVARLLETASEETLPFFALGAFAGLRTGEIERLEWRDIRFEERLVEVPALSSKTASRRFVTMRPNLLAWLEPSYRGRHGKVCPGDLTRRLLADRRAAGLKEWKVNALRHSFASYHLAHFKNAAELALEMGHTNASITFRHYRELVRPSEAERFWRIVPAVHAQSIAVVA